MRIEYKFCPNLTIIDTPGACNSVFKSLYSGTPPHSCMAAIAGNELRPIHCSHMLAPLPPLQASSPPRPASATPRCRTAPSRCEQSSSVRTV